MNYPYAIKEENREQLYWLIPAMMPIEMPDVK
jgi:hypothetical protein